MSDMQKAIHICCTHLDEFGDKYTFIKPSSQSMPLTYPSPPKVSFQPYYYYYYMCVTTTQDSPS